MTKLQRCLLIALFALVPISSTYAAPRSEDEIRDAVKAMIMNRHPDDTPGWWRGLGPSAPDVIIKVYESDTSTYHHMRLIEGLSAFTEDRVAVDFIKRQAERSSDDVVRNNAIKMIGIAQGAKEEEFLSGYLSHEDPHTRLAAAQALKGVAPGKVSAFIAREKTPWVVAKLKGEKVATSKALVPSGSSEDRPSPDLAGVWRGFRVGPEAQLSQGAPKKLVSEAVELRLSVKGSSELSGSARVTSATGLKIIELSGLAGKGTRFGGRWSEIPLEGDVVQQAGGFYMQVRMPQTGALLWLKRD
jgi:hypothetical protein